MMQRIQSEELKIQQIISNHLDSGQPIMDHTDDIDTSTIFSELKSANSFVLFTNFSESELKSFLNRIKPYCIEPTKRGPKSKLNWVDSCLILLMYYKSYWELEKLEKFTKQSAHTITSVITRYRIIFNKFLNDEWLKTKRRPEINHSNFPYVGINFDHTSIEIYKPYVEYNSAKRFFDSKNKIYAFKKGVGILPISGYAVFIFESIPGSVHDYQDLKDHYLEIVDYLRKTETERNNSSITDPHLSWYATFDKGYVGDETKDTPGLRKLVPNKNPQSSEDYQRTRDIYANHHIERFFGRMKRLWKIVSSVYRNDKTSFDIDANNCILLTNEHIRFYHLLEDDKAFHQALLFSRVTNNTEKDRKRKAQQDRYMEAKKLRLDDTVIRQ